MAFKKGTKSNEQTTKIDEKEKVAQLQHEKAISDSLNSEKAQKDILLKTTAELSAHIAAQRKEIQALSSEMETKQRIINNQTEEIKAQNLNLSRNKERIEAENKKFVDALNKKISEVEAADLEYKKLLKEASEDRQKVKNEIQKLSDDRALIEGQLANLQRHVTFVEGEASKKEVDIKTREEALVKEQEEFEAYKSSLEPELARISEIKNENLLLLQKIESDRASFENQYKSFQSEKEISRENNILEGARIKEYEQKLKNQEAKLRQWEEDLKDADLQLQVEKKEVLKMRERYELNEKLKK